MTKIDKRITPSERRGAGTARPAVNSLIDTIRAAARHLVSLRAPDTSELAVRLVADSYSEVAEACPVTEDLRPWQLLASDLAAALEPIDVERGQRASDLADEIRATIAMIERNPVEELALRPASRRVLLALDASGGRAGHGAVRDRSQHSATHFANILKPLRAHGLVKVERDPQDRRSRILELTEAGRVAIAGQAQSRRPGEQAYAGYLHVSTPSRSSEDAYPLAPASALDAG